MFVVYTVLPISGLLVIYYKMYTLEMEFIASVILPKDLKLENISPQVKSQN